MPHLSKSSTAAGMLLLLAILAGFVIMEAAPKHWQAYALFIWPGYLVVVAYKMRELNVKFASENYQRIIKPSYQITVFAITGLGIILYMLQDFWTTPDFFVRLLTQPIVWIPVWVYLVVMVLLATIEIYVRTTRDRANDQADLPNVAFLRWSPGWQSVWDIVEVIATIAIVQFAVQFVTQSTTLVPRLCGFVLVFVALTKVLTLINALLYYPQTTWEEYQEGYEE